MLQELSIEQVVTMYEKTVGWKQEELMKALPKEQQVEFKRAILLAKGPIVGTERGGFGGGGMVGADPSSLTGAGQGVCVFVCVRACLHACMRVCEYARACVRACVRAFVRACVCVFVLIRPGSRRGTSHGETKARPAIAQGPSARRVLT